MNPTQQGHVSTRIEGNVATVSFYHPLQNSLPGRLLAELTDAFNTLATRSDVYVIILKSDGDRTFCAGASFDELASIADFEQGHRFFMGFANVINAMRKCPQFVIGRIQGKAVGGGVGLASTTDYCFATRHAAVKLSELAVGIGPFVVGPACERKMGLSAFSELAINATEWRSAEWAHQKGLFHEVFDTIEDMDKGIAALAARLAGSSPEAMRELKRVCWRDTDHWDELLAARAAISGRLVLSDFTRNAIASFKAK